MHRDHCRECGGKRSFEGRDAEFIAWFEANFPDFCSEECEYYFYHPEDN